MSVGLQEFIKKSDVSCTGDLNLQEFLDHLIQHERQLHFVFTSLDEDRDGEWEGRVMSNACELCAGYETTYYHFIVI